MLRDQLTDDDIALLLKEAGTPEDNIPEVVSKIRETINLARHSSYRSGYKMGSTNPVRFR
jgi:hypothetical protein